MNFCRNEQKNICYLIYYICRKPLANGVRYNRVPVVIQRMPSSLAMVFVLCYAFSRKTEFFGPQLVHRRQDVPQATKENALQRVQTNPDPAGGNITLFSPVTYSIVKRFIVAERCSSWCCEAVIAYSDTTACSSNLLSSPRVN